MMLTHRKVIRTFWNFTICEMRPTLILKFQHGDLLRCQTNLCGGSMYMKFIYADSAA